MIVVIYIDLNFFLQDIYFITDSLNVMPIFLSLRKNSSVADSSPSIFLCLTSNIADSKLILMFCLSKKFKQISTTFKGFFQLVFLGML